MHFDEKVYNLLKNIPKGKVTTYKAIAEALSTKAYRAVGNALNRNKSPENVPYYKVVNSDGTLGGYSRGIAEKTARLKEDGIKVLGGRIADFETVLYRF